MREEADIADEKRLAAKIVAQAKVTAPRLATMSAISEHRNRWVAYKVSFHGNPQPGGTASHRERSDQDKRKSYSILPRGHVNTP